MDLVLAGEGFERGGESEIVWMFDCNSSETEAVLETSHCVSVHFFSAVNFSVKFDWDFLGFLAHLWLTLRLA